MIRAVGPVRPVPPLLRLERLLGVRYLPATIRRLHMHAHV
jgi:hypothetical protein